MIEEQVNEDNQNKTTDSQPDGANITQPVDNQQIPTQVIVQSKKPLIVIGVILVIIVAGLTSLFFGWRLLSSQKTTESLLTPSASRSAKNEATPSAATKSASILTQNCSSATYKYSIEYPITWFTTQRAEKEKCQYFNPTVFSFPKAWDGPLTPISVKPISLTEWGSTKALFASNSASQKIVAKTETKVGNQPAQRVTVEFSANGSFEQGAVGVSYLIDHPQIPLLIQFQTTKANDQNARDYIKVLDDMAKSIKFLQ